MRKETLKKEELSIPSNQSSLDTVKNNLKRQIWQQPVVEVISSAETAAGSLEGTDGPANKS